MILYRFPIGHGPHLFYSTFVCPDYGDPNGWWFGTIHDRWAIEVRWPNIENCVLVAVA